MHEDRFLLMISIAGLVIVNVAAYKYTGLWGLFVSASSIPFAEKLIKKI